MKTEALTRVHPQTYHAFIKAGLAVNADKIVLSSGWRPMLGSVLHRLGVSLDVGYIQVGKTQNQFQRSATAEEATLNHFQKTHGSEIKSLIKKQNAGSLKPEEEIKLKQLRDEQQTKQQAAELAIHGHEGKHTYAQKFIDELLKSAEVRQVFTPWRMEDNTADIFPPKTNWLRTGNETLHHHHLHITLFDEESTYARR